MIDPIMLTGIALVVLGIGEQKLTIGAGVLLIVLSALNII